MGEIIDKVKGRIKQAAGILTGDKRLKHAGQMDETRGEAKGMVEEVKHTLEDPKKEKD